MKQDTKQAILDAAAPLIYSQGFHRTGLKEILDAAGVPKGSFYFYFKSKDDFGLALIDHYSASLRERSALLLQDMAIPPLERLSRFFLRLSEMQCQGGFVRGCPIGNLAQEMSDLSPAMRERLNHALQAISHTIARVLQEAGESGELPAGLDTEQTAAFIFDAWEGALLRMKAEKSAAALDRFHEFVFNRLLQ